MDLRDVLDAVRRRYWLLLGSILLGVALAAVLTWSATPLYSSSVRLLVSTSDQPEREAVEPQDLAWSRIDAVYQADRYAKQRLSAYAEAIESEQMAGRVVEALGLDLTPAQVARQVNSFAVPSTVIIDVTITDTSAERARDIGGALEVQFAEWVREVEGSGDPTNPVVTVSTVQAAEIDRRPVSPNVPRDLGLGGALGLLLGLGLVVLRRPSNATVTNGDDIEALTGAELIGAVPEDARPDRQDGAIAVAGSSMWADAFPAGVRALDEAGPPRVIVVTGVLPGDGASTVALHLAGALARRGRRVTLVEADLARPQLSRALGLASGPGLADVLAGAATVAEATRHLGDRRPAVLPAGPGPAQVGDMGGRSRMGAVLATLRGTQDHVIVDAPSVRSSPDAAALGVLADGCLLVARFGSTRRELLAEAARELSLTGASLLGVVLNRIPKTAAARQGSGYRYAADPERGGAAAIRLPGVGVGVGTSVGRQAHGVDELS